MMKTKKKGIAKLSALILALVLAVGMLSGCSGSDEEETTAVQTTEAAAEEETEAAEPEETEAAQTEETEGSSAGLSGSAEDETDADGSSSSSLAADETEASVN